MHRLHLSVGQSKRSELTCASYTYVLQDSGNSGCLVQSCKEEPGRSRGSGNGRRI